jgi:hypothetical protein
VLFQKHSRSAKALLLRGQSIRPCGTAPLA